MGLYQTMIDGQTVRRRLTLKLFRTMLLFTGCDAKVLLLWLRSGNEVRVGRAIFQWR